MLTPIQIRHRIKQYYDYPVEMRIAAVYHRHHVSFTVMHQLLTDATFLSDEHVNKIENYYRDIENGIIHLEDVPPLEF